MVARKSNRQRLTVQTPGGSPPKQPSCAIAKMPVLHWKFARAVDYIRTQLLNSGQSFSFETVFSHQSKLDFIMKAKQCGYRVYLYFVCLEPPDLCLSRVAIRVAQHGHDVPSDKVLERYRRCLDLLPNAIKTADRSYLFDNSETASGEKIESSLVIEVERADDTFSIVTHRSELPAWISNHIPFKFP